MTSKREEKCIGKIIIIIGLVLLVGSTFIMREDRAYIAIVLICLGIIFGGCFIYGFPKGKKLKSKSINVFKKYKK